MKLTGLFRRAPGEAPTPPPETEAPPPTPEKPGWSQSMQGARFYHTANRRSNRRLKYSN